MGRAAILTILVSTGHWTLEGGVGTILQMSTRTLRRRRIVSYYVQCTFCRFWIAKTLVGTLNKDKVLVGAFSGHCPVDSSRQILVTILVWQYWWQCYSMQWQCDCDHVKLRSDVTTARNVATSARWQHARTVTRHTHISTHSYQFIRQTYPSISHIAYCNYICVELVEFSELYSST